jgi:hypothetical protein
MPSQHKGCQEHQETTVPSKSQEPLMAGLRQAPGPPSGLGRPLGELYCSTGRSGMATDKITPGFTTGSCTSGATCGGLQAGAPRLDGHRASMEELKRGRRAGLCASACTGQARHQLGRPAGANLTAISFLTEGTTTPNEGQPHYEAAPRLAAGFKPFWLKYHLRASQGPGGGRKRTSTAGDAAAPLAVLGAAGASKRHRC